MKNRINYRLYTINNIISIIIALVFLKNSPLLGTSDHKRVENWIESSRINNPIITITKTTSSRPKSSSRIDEWINSSKINAPLPSFSQNKHSSLSEEKEKSLIIQWLKETNRDKYGDPISIYYPPNKSLYLDSTHQLRYIKHKYPNQPWLEFKSH